ncbi:MAG: helix-turn-helix domain-containing protein [bacterium]
MEVSLVKDLIDFGLSDKAARVYLASLQLGPSTAQQIANKAEEKRSTTYVMIESLMEQGLVSSFTKGKKRFFTAEDPEQLLSILEKKKRDLEERAKSVTTKIKDFRALQSFSSNPPNVSYYEGVEGVRALRNDVLRTDVKTIREIVPIDEVTKFWNDDDEKDNTRSLIGKKFKIKTIYTASAGKIFPKDDGKSESKFIDKQSFDIKSEIIIYGRKVTFLSFLGRPAGFLVEDQSVADTFVAIFDKLWGQQ